MVNLHVNGDHRLFQLSITQEQAPGTMRSRSDVAIGAPLDEQAEACGHASANSSRLMAADLMGSVRGRRHSHPALDPPLGAASPAVPALSGSGSPSLTPPHLL